MPISLTTRPGTSPLRRQGGDGDIQRPAPEAPNRLLSTAEAAAYVGLAASTLEKRRVTGLDSPPFVQSVARGSVRYRLRDLEVWLEARTFRNTSER